MYSGLGETTIGRTQTNAIRSFFNAPGLVLAPPRVSAPTPIRLIPPGPIALPPPTKLPVLKLPVLKAKPTIDLSPQSPIASNLPTLNQAATGGGQTTGGSVPIPDTFSDVIGGGSSTATGGMSMLPLLALIGVGAYLLASKKGRR